MSIYIYRFLILDGCHMMRRYPLAVGTVANSLLTSPEDDENCGLDRKFVSPLVSSIRDLLNV